MSSPTPPLGRDAPYPSQVYAWFVIFVLILANFIAYIDRQVVAIVADDMKVDLAASDFQMGFLYGVFAIFYAIAAFPIAWLADNYSRKHIIAGGIFFWSVATIFCGLFRNYWTLFLGRIGVGVGEATLTPATNSLIGDYFPPKRIPLALSVVQAGPIMGSGIAFIIGGFVYQLVDSTDPMVVPVLGELASWQQTFIFVGAPGLVLAFFFLLLREPLRRATSTENGVASYAAAKLDEITSFYGRHAKMFTLHHIGNLAFGLLGYAFVFWTVSYFSRVHGVPNYESSKIFGWIFLIAGPLGPLIIAWWARLLSRLGHKDANMISPVIGGTLGVVFVIAIQFVTDPLWAYVLYVPAMMFVNSPFAMAYAALTVVTPAPMRARVAAVYMFVVSFGMMLGPPIAGLFNDIIFPGDDGVRYSLITVTAIFGVIGAVCLWLARKPYQACLQEAEAREAL